MQQYLCLEYKLIEHREKSSLHIGVYQVVPG